MPQFIKHLVDNYEKLPFILQVIVSNLLKLFGVLFGIKQSLILLLDLNNPIVNLGGFCFITGFVFFSIGLFCISFSMITGNFN